VSALLIYRNDSPDALTWAEDYKARSSSIHKARWEWMARLYDEHDIAEEARGGFTRDRSGTFSGISWPTDVPLPAGWFRPVKTPELIKPRSNTAPGKRLWKEMARFDQPDVVAELRERFGMPEVVFAGLHIYSAGVRFEDDAVWVTWGDRKVADLIDAEKLAEHGWVRVPLVDYIKRFGEDAL
jgi:hypothetical protein